VAVRDHVEQGTQQPASGGQHHQYGNRAGHHETDHIRHAEGFGAGRERRGQCEERHHGDVLEQHHAERETPMRAIELGALGELLHDENRGAHGDHATQHDALRPGMPNRWAMGATTAVVPSTCRLPSPNTSRRNATMRGQENSRPSCEQQEHYPQLGQQMRGVGFGKGAQRVRPECQADSDVTQDGRQAQPPRQRHDEHRHGQQDDDESEGESNIRPES
jgi:hypothetical protein